jgi:hypothetical protein
MRVGFLFNHDQIHQIAHSLPIAVALAARHPDISVICATTNFALADEVERLLGPNRSHNICHIRLRINSAGRRITSRMFGGLLPAAKLLVYGEHLDFFRSLDALVATERTSLILKTQYGLDRPLMILADHGAGDRAIGFGKSTALFDHILAAGPKIRDRLVAEAGVDPDRVSVTGYAKFDMVPDTFNRLPMQRNGRPTVLYNPHLSPHLSSWYNWGRDILDWFLEQDRYNLIFAPHIMLFQRSVVFTIDKFRVHFPGFISPSFAKAAHMHVDLGSRASTDMTYTNCADIYLGDASSQVYEFLRTPRPCAFLNPLGIAHQGDPNFAHWRAGPVINNLRLLESGLASAVSDHDVDYRPKQQQLLDYTFATAAQSASSCAVSAIVKLLTLDAPTPSERRETALVS